MTEARDIAVILPAAGASRRMQGRDKLMEEVDGLPLLRRQALRACAAVELVCVTVPDLGHPRARVVHDLPVTCVPIPDAAQGMSASLRRAFAALPGHIIAAMVLPADMPEIETADMAQVIDSFRAAASARLVQATGEDGTPGHPTLFPADCFAAMSTLAGDKGAREVVAQNRDRLLRVPLKGARALVDLDTPEDWANWRAARSGKTV